MRLSVTILVCLFFCRLGACQAPAGIEEAIVRIIKSGGYEGHDDKMIGRVGDAAAVAITRVVRDRDLSPGEIERVLLVIRMSFAAPRIVEIESDREPRTTLLLLRYLDNLRTTSRAQAKDCGDEEVRRASG